MHLFEDSYPSNKRVILIMTKQGKLFFGSLRGDFIHPRRFDETIDESTFIPVEYAQSWMEVKNIRTQVMKKRAHQTC